ncbi:ras GEF [Cucurbitaria berberidis CBS 394.84]|uniref:Ras GEF n=1 Tax=Cucurbitaria berberidis CBS 394.84 TaxID=1168544 RepID=A0A9P4GMQ7_9PLEO|nr:ras GEF [Cucurbitaria berberidis CBS 394.84]KAF1848279.1 ras GEF [Cucurbitaria berberidis CBS 394.84]
MALSALQQNDAYPGPPGSPVDRLRDDVLPGAESPKRRADSPRRLRRVKDSKEQLNRRTRARATSNATIETSTSNSTSAGRSYTVANVHNGVIYLRPVVRAGHQRTRPQPDPFVFPPQTPPDSATLDSKKLRPTSNDWEQSLYGSRTPRSEPTPPLLDARADNASQLQPPAEITTGLRPVARSHSFSTADEHTATSLSNEPGTFKVVIERPPFGGRPKTADTGSLPLLQVPIPHYRLGTPRFSTRGTADLRSSVYTRTSGTDDFANSLLTPQRAGTHSFLSSRPRSDAYSPIPHRYRATMDRPPLPTSAPSSARVSHAPIGPRLYDALTVNPDDRAVVRFSTTGEILAATPSRLVAHITSPSFLDYELLSDFFLTFRAFLSTKDLVAYLISRLRWAVDRQDDFGRIVRVRTFVALRHWILNYFVDDFVPVYKLRSYFCELVNSLHSDLRAREDGGGGDIKIVGELKKCWRRTCAQYWEMEDEIGQDFADDELLPGGQTGSQDSIEEIPYIAATPITPKRQTARDTKETIGSNPSDQFATRHLEWAQKARHTPQNSVSVPYVPSQEYDIVQVPLSPASEQSMHVLSCSLPMRGLNKTEQAIDLPLYPHPVPVATARSIPSPQRVMSAKIASRPSHAHKRSGSFSDALRDSRAPLSIPKTVSTDLAMSAVSNMPGSLVRGGLFQPGSPYFEVKGVRYTRSQLLQEAEEAYGNDLQRPGHASSPGMKKILGTVRRALSTRQSPGASPQLGGLRQPPPTRSSNPGTISTAAGGVQKRRTARPKPEVRIDLLASVVGESFKEAVKEQLEREQQPSQDEDPPELGGFEFEFDKRRAPSSDEQKSSNNVDPRVYSNITSGSKSILIIDDTGAPPLPVMSGALPADIDAATVSTMPLYDHQRQASIDERLAEGSIPIARHSELYDDLESHTFKQEQRISRPSLQRPAARQRRSMSEGREQMHSFRRRGSNKTSIARSISLRRHASYNSGLSRRRGPASVATFQTMSSDNDPFFLDRQLANETAGPARQLRRRPGGDLRAADNIHDLETTQRPHSTGSVSNRTHSIANSVILRSDRYVEPGNKTSRQVEEAVDPVVTKKRISMVDTHSSQPNLRPSFEAEVAKLAALPDDIDDDGGIESALMKLEGRYEKKSPSLPSERSSVDLEVYQPSGTPVNVSQSAPSDEEACSETNDVFHRPTTPSEADGQGMYRHSAENFTRRVPAGTSVGESTDSYSSIPLLDRALSEFTASPRARTLETIRSSAKPSPLKHTGTTPQAAQAPTVSSSGNSSIEYVTETESMKRIPHGGTLPVSSVPRQSFLLDDGEDLSDMDSTTGARSDQTSHGVRSFFDDELVTPDHETDGLPTHPMRHPPTPPPSGHRLKETLPNPTVFERGLATPSLTPTASRPNNLAFTQSGQLVDSPIEPHESHERSSTLTTHLPFVLAYDSEVLAQQFTIVEKDALDEIDWKELIELRWKQSSPQIRDWVQYLRTQEARGVDVVIARFNLVVKWVVSECILTESVEERARCIVKYIHIATHARKLRNYATMYQIAIALISNDVSRLKKTWALVPASELLIMQELEALVQPLKNFHNLRLEMETVTVDDGCIPFIGIYTRDLIYNAQKPAFIDAPPVDGERLVNFERHHTAATIVKNLLRLLEASSKYSFKVEPTILSKCLWLAALGDDEITRRSRQSE